MGDFFISGTVRRRGLSKNAGVAQLAEHVLGKDGVTSSILVSSLSLRK